MKTFYKIVKRVVVVVGLAIGVGSAQAQNLPGGQPANPASVYGGFSTSVSNVQSYINVSNVVIYATNSAASLTNLINTSLSTASLFSDWTLLPSPTVPTNSAFAGGTNDGIIQCAGSRFLTLQFSGYMYSNGAAFTPGAGNSVTCTNQIYLARSSYQNPSILQWEIAPAYLIQFTATNGYFSFVTNIEDDAVAALQVSAWNYSCTNSPYGITNPVIHWHGQ